MDENVIPLRRMTELETKTIQLQILTAYLNKTDPGWRVKVGKGLDLAWESLND